MILSIGMIVKNEEGNLERCLSSLRPLMRAVPSELIVVDTGSTDRTVAIAKEYTDKVYFHLWENDYSKMRNFTLDYASGDWFFFIDADEELADHDALAAFLMSEESQRYQAASVKINSLYQTGDTGRFASGAVVRLFRRTAGSRFTGVIHEQPLFDPPLFKLDTVLIHHGYVVDDLELRIRKLRIYEPILTQALDKNPEDVYLWYQLSKTYATYQDAQTALAPAIRAYEAIKIQKLNPEDYLYVYTNLANLYLIEGNLKKTEEIAEEGLKIKEWIIDLWFYMAKAQGIGKKWDESIKSYQKYLYYVDRYDQYGDQDIRIISYTLNGKEEAYLDLSILYRQIGNQSEALKALRKVESAEVLENSILPVIDLLSDLQEYGLMRSIYDRLKGRGRSETWTGKLLETALQAETCDEKTYVIKLRKALQEYPEMKKGIEILLKKITDKMESSEPPAVSELEAYAQIVKANIKQLIEQGMQKEAGQLIEAFEQIIPNDPEIGQLKANMEARLN